MRGKILLFASLILLSSCQSNSSTISETSVAQQGFPFSYTDYSGYTTTFTKKPENVAVLFSSYAQIWDLVGGEINVTVGDSVKRGFAKDGTTLVNSGAGLKIDNEILLAAKPDLVITTFDFAAQQKTAETCRSNGIPALELKEESFSDYLSILDLFCRLNENTTAYQEYGIAVQKRIEEIVAKERKTSPSYLFIRAGAAYSSTKIRKTEDHFACQIFTDLGGINVADSLNSMTEDISLEAILMAQPDKIIVAPQGDEEASNAYITSLFQEDGWSSVKAVKDNQVYFVSKELFNYKPNQKWDESYQKAYEILYPEA